MRILATTLFTLLIATAVLAQSKNEFDAYVSNATLSHTSTDGTHSSASFGLAFNRMLTPRISAQLAIGSERHHTYSYIFDPNNGSFRNVTPLGFRTHPIDLSVRYQFANDTRWKPYLGIGARYVQAPGVGSEFRFQNHIGPELVGGTAVNLTRHFGLVLDGKAYFGDREPYDSQVKTSFGLLWRF